MKTFRVPTLALAALVTLAPSRRLLTEDETAGRFDWDIVSLEQNNNRFNGSVLSGFHSIRSPGVTPWRAWKTGLGLLYSHEEQTASQAASIRDLENDLVIVNPKLNYGFLPHLEGGLGVEFNYADGETVDRMAGGGIEDEHSDNFNVSAAVGGLKWNLYRDARLRLATAFDTRVATREKQFGMLPATLFNFEVDGDYAFTSRFSLVSNLQFMTSDKSAVSDQIIFDLAGNYSFTDRFRGMLFGTVQEDDEADDAVFFVGFAGQYVVDQHSFTVALDFQLNDARRDVRTDNQIDLEFSYTFTF
jgi:hypothetical protein